MKQIIVKANEIAISYKNGAIQNVYTPGKHTIGLFENTTRYELGEPYTAPINIEIALQNLKFLAIVDTITVPDNHIAVKMYNGQFQELLRTGIHVFFKNVNETTFQLFNLNEYKIDEAIDVNILKLQAFQTLIRQFEVMPYEKALQYVDGKLEGVLEPGRYLYFNNHTVIHVLKVDMRAQAIELSGQEILTKDKAQLRMNLNAKFKIVDILQYSNTNKEAEKQMYTAIQMAARTVIGRLTIDELLEDKESLNTAILTESIAATKALGIEVLSCGIKDIILPAEIKNILNQVLIAEKRAQANIITRREETASTRSLLNTAKLMEDNAMLMKLKEMEYVEKIAEKLDSISLNGNSQIVDQLKTIFVK